MRKIISVTLIWVLSVGSLFAAEPESYGNVIVSKIVSVYDADTFRCNIEGWPAIVGKSIPVRVNGIDTPEMTCKKTYSKETCTQLKQLARTARRLTENMLKKAKVIELRNIQRGKYFRIVADVYVDDKSLADILIKNKLALPYDGGTKTDWAEVVSSGNKK